jgi:hypothetical protein
MKRPLLTLAGLALAVFAVQPASAACMNKFLRRGDGPRQVVTLLTGKLTFQEAQALSAAIQQNKAPAIQWVDEKGKEIARQFGELKVVRPMPVGCDGKASGVVAIVTFPTPQQPRTKMSIKLDNDTIVVFDESQ